MGTSLVKCITCSAECCTAWRIRPPRSSKAVPWTIEQQAYIVKSILVQRISYYSIACTRPGGVTGEHGNPQRPISPLSTVGALAFGVRQPLHLRITTRSKTPGSTGRPSHSGARYFIS